MKLSESIKPISYIKSHSGEVLDQLEATHGTMIVTVNGEAKAVLQDIGEYEKTRDSLALLKILALSRRSLEQGKSTPARKAFRRIREHGPVRDET
jgi:prevent-host-death family protein